MNLNTLLANDNPHFTVFGVAIYYYAVIIVCGMILGITHTIRFLRRGLRTVKFSSDGGFACHPQHLHSSTGTSVAPRWFHCSVSTSPHAAVTEY